MTNGMMCQLGHSGEIDHVVIGGRRYLSREAILSFSEANTRSGIAYRSR